MTNKHFILKDKEIVEVDLMTWAEWFEKSPDRFVRQDPVGKYKVSTVFLGIDHNFSPVGDPILFETMIFGGKFDDEEYQERYRTYDEAVEGHKKALEVARNAG